MMRKSLAKFFFTNSFLLSLLLHCLLLLFFSSILLSSTKEKKKLPHLYVPAYVYTSSHFVTSSSHSYANKMQTTKLIRNEKIIKEKIIAKKSFKTIENSQKNIIKNEQQENNNQSMIAASFNTLQQWQQETVRNAQKPAEKPIYLVGDDENLVSDPLIRLMGEALSEHFAYPETAGQFGITGKVLIELTLHPQGYFSDIHIIQSSHDHDLDAAALYAVNEAPLVAGANRFLSQPQRFIVGFIFK